MLQSCHKGTVFLGGAEIAICNPGRLIDVVKPGALLRELLEVGLHW